MKLILLLLFWVLWACIFMVKIFVVMATVQLIRVSSFLAVLYVCHLIAVRFEVFFKFTKLSHFKVLEHPLLNIKVRIIKKLKNFNQVGKLGTSKISVKNRKIANISVNIDFRAILRRYTVGLTRLSIIW